MRRRRGASEGDEPTANGVLVLAGPPCAGKSTVGKALATEATRGRRIHIDVDSLFLLLRPDSDRNRQDRMLAYDAAHALARMLLERAHTPVLECTYARGEQRASLMTAVADLPQASLWVVELFITSNDAVQRFRHRNEGTDLDEESLRERVNAFPYSDQALQLAASAPPAVLAHRIAAWLRGKPTPTPRDVCAEAGRTWN